MNTDTQKPWTGLLRLYALPASILLAMPIVLEMGLRFFHISSSVIENLIGFFALGLFYILMFIREQDLIDHVITAFDEIFIEKIYMYIYMINAAMVALTGAAFKGLHLFPSTVRAYTFFCVMSFLYFIIYLVRVFFFEDEEQDKTFRVFIRISECLFMYGILAQSL
jgi:uncharacterized membrane protein